MRNLLKWSLSVALVLSGPAVLASTVVDSFSPQGTVKGVRQVRVHFSEQIVAFGDMHLPDPFEPTCTEKGTGRWVDGKNWSYDFERDLPAGVNCSFSLKPDLKDLTGNAVQAERAYTFSTDGPAIIESVPYEGSTYVDENQIFLLGLDASADQQSIEKNVYCTASGINEKIGVRVIEGKLREDLLASHKGIIDRYLSVYFKAHGSIWRTDLALSNKRLDKLPIVLLQCKQSLPAESDVRLNWSAGVASLNGVVSEHDQVLVFKTRPEFTARFSCTRTNAKAHCIPFLPMTIEFSAPVKTADAKLITMTGANGKVVRPFVDDQKSGFVSDITFKGPFTEQATYTISVPATLNDDAGRHLLNQQLFPLKVSTDQQPPLVKFPSRFGILEAGGDRLLPVTVRNVEPVLDVTTAEPASVQGAVMRVEEDQDMSIIQWLKRLSGRNNGWNIGETWQEQMEHSIFGHDETLKNFTLPKPRGARAFEVIGIPLKTNGFFVVELKSPKLGQIVMENGAMAFVQSGVLVTNLAAHFKHGAESSLVWVTTLDKGQPVANANVAVRNCEGKSLWEGKADKFGIAHINEALPPSVCGYQPGYFISARSQGDMTFTLSNWEGGIETWRFNVPTQDVFAENNIVTTVFDRTLLRVGETVHMKHLVRQHTLNGIAFVSDENNALFQQRKNRRGVVVGNSAAIVPQITITHEGTDQKYELPLIWSGNGSAESSWQIPAGAKLGVYNVTIGTHAAGTFRVEAFRVPTMRAILQGPKQPLIQASAFGLDVQLNYLAGGAASGAPVKLRTSVQEKQVAFSDYEGFAFSNGEVRLGSVKDVPGIDENDTGDDEAPPSESGVGALEGVSVQTRTLSLDNNGAARIAIDRLPAIQKPQDMLAELEYKDANGETLAVSTHIPLWNSNYLIGVKPDGWAVSKEHFKFQVMVLNLNGKPAPNAEVQVDFLERKGYSHRHRLIGGFYAFENTTEVNLLGAACSGRTDDKGMLFCEVKAPVSGNVILQAKTMDDSGRLAYANCETWVAGSEEWWFGASDNDRIDVIPEKKRYEPGDEATFQVRMPFRHATALVTVEREGIIDSYIRDLSGKNPVFSIPVKNEYGPNVYVSVFVVRGRVNSTQPTALVDLGKPAYKMGIARMQVGWKVHELTVQVRADKQVYKTRDKAKVQIKVTQADGKPLPPRAEIALAAVDVGLLELMPNTSWNLLEAMMQERSLQVTTSTAQMQVIGKRHFGRKAVPHGGGGGKSAGRELFDTLLFWKGKITLNKDGEASVEIPLNDSLTSFRIVAIANANADLFGTGSIDVRSSQDLILLSGLPSLVREGDRYTAGFTLRNTSTQSVTAEVNATVSGAQNMSQSKSHKSVILQQQSITLEAGEAKDVSWDYTVPVGTGELIWDVAAQTSDKSFSDKLRIKQKVTFAVPTHTYQATLMQIAQPVSMQVQIPSQALPGHGGIQTILSPRLGNELPGVLEYMKQYPYTCFEQISSKAVALGDETLWKNHIRELPAYLDSDGLVKYFPMMDWGSDSLTAYILTIAVEAGYTIPEPSRKRMEQGLLAFVQGRISRNSSMPTADVAIRKMAALEALSRSDLVTPDLLESFSVEPNLWPTSAVIDWYLVLLRTQSIPARNEKMLQVEQILRSRLNFQGTTMGFSTERKDDLWWLMISSDVNANRILLAMLDNERWHDDIGRLVRGTLGRQHKGRWNTTVANAWGTLAIKKYSDKFEAVAVTGSTQINLSPASNTLDWSKNESGASYLQPWPQKSQSMTITHSGTGKPWVTIQSLAAIPLTQPLSSGYKVTKTIVPIEQKTSGTWSSGDVYRVHLDLEAQADMTWVVVDDPIPASASILGNGLGRDSKILSQGEKRQGWVWPAFEEKTFEAFRAYFEFVPKGKWSVEYTVRVNNAGEFGLPQTRVEAMYSPEMFGELPNQKLHVYP